MAHSVSGSAPRLDSENSLTATLALTPGSNPKPGKYAADDMFLSGVPKRASASATSAHEARQNLLNPWQSSCSRQSQKALRVEEVMQDAFEKHLFSDTELESRARNFKAWSVSFKKVQKEAETARTRQEMSAVESQVLASERALNALCAQSGEATIERLLEGSVFSLSTYKREHEAGFRTLSDLNTIVKPYGYDVVSVGEFSKPLGTAQTLLLEAGMPVVSQRNLRHFDEKSMLAERNGCDVYLPVFEFGKLKSVVIVYGICHEDALNLHQNDFLTQRRHAISEAFTEIPTSVAPSSFTIKYLNQMSEAQFLSWSPEEARAALEKAYVESRVLADSFVAVLAHNFAAADISTQVKMLNLLMLFGRQNAVLLILHNGDKGLEGSSQDHRRKSADAVPTADVSRHCDG